MFVRVDTVRGIASLEDPIDTRSLYVEVVGDGDVAGPLARFGELEGDHAWIDVVELKASALGHVPDTWLHDFEGMIEFARERGWLNDDGTRVRAHLTHVEAPKEKRRRFW